MVSVPQFVEEAKSRHEGRVERRHERQDKRHARRVRFGEIVSQADLDSGDAILDDVGPGEPVPAEEATEPWATDKPLAALRERLGRYQAFLADWREEHPDDPTGDEPGEPYDSGEEDSGD